MNAYRRCWFALLVVALTGCSAGPPAQPGLIRSLDYELFPTTRELHAEDLTLLRQVSEDGELRFEATPAALEGLAPGEVLLSGVSEKTPAGLLRLVLSVGSDATDALVLRTAAAPLQLAFRKLHARVADHIAPFAAGAQAAQSSSARSLSLRAVRIGGELGEHENYQVVVFDGDGSLATTNDQLVIDASLGGGLAFNLSIDVDWGIVENVPEIVAKCAVPLGLLDGELPTCDVDKLMPELKLGLEVAPFLDAEVKVSGAASVGFEEDFSIATLTLPPLTLGPLVFLPSADIVATIAGSASARFSASAYAHIKTSTRVELSSKIANSKIVPFEVQEAEAEADTPEVDLYAQASVKPGVRFALALYGVLGPYATVSAVAKLIADPLHNPCWDFHVGVETQLGVLVKTPSLPVIGSYTFLDWNTGALPLFDESVASGACEVTAEGQSVPPGGGPNAVTLQKPPFTPWAKLLGAPADGSDLASVLAFSSGFPFLTPSIDGRYVAGGGAAQGLLKFDGDGNATWSSQLHSVTEVALRSLGSVPSADAGLVTLYRHADASAFVLVKQAQSGALEGAAAYRLPDECGAKAQTLMRDGARGFVVSGECPFLRSAFVAHLAEDLTVIRSRRLYDADTSTVRLSPTAVTRSDEDAVVVGDLIREGESAGSLAFVLRLDEQDEPRLASSFACPERLSLYPTAVIPSSAGNLTLVGDASGIGYVARIGADGSLGFARFPNLGGGIQSGFAPNSVVELPTTGLVIAATVSGANDTPADLILVGLDGDGRTQWGREYTLLGADGLRALGWPSARLTDDGGILITATAGAANDSLGELLGMKVFARDGSLADSSLITSAPILPEQTDYLVEPRPLRVLTEDIALAAASFDGRATLNAQVSQSKSRPERGLRQPWLRK